MKLHTALLVCLAAVLGEARAADRFDDIRTYIRAELAAQSLPSVAVAVAKDGKIIWEEGFGWADRERRVPSTPHTMYSLASISKPITATGVMTLVQSGKVDLDKPLNDYLGLVKLRARIGDAKDATVRRVTDHTAGLPLHSQYFYADEPYTRPSMDETILRYGNLVTAPGEQMQYNNLGFGMLDYVIERVSGVGYAQYMRNEVFLPLGMTRTSINIGPGLEPYAATRYDSNGLPLPFYDFSHRGAAAVFSSAHDLARFGMFHLKTHLPDQKAILSDANIDEMHHRLSGMEGRGYGIGFDVRRVHGSVVVSHTGRMSGVDTSLQMFPAEKLAIVVLGNANSGLPDAVADRIASKLVPGWKPAKSVVRSEDPPFRAPAELLGTWKGTLSTYLKDMPVELRFMGNGDIHAKVGDQSETLVSDAYYENGEFYGRLVARVDTPDTDRFDYKMILMLKRRDGVLNGMANAMAVEGPRIHFALAHWIELNKSP